MLFLVLCRFFNWLIYNKMPSIITNYFTMCQCVNIVYKIFPLFCFPGISSLVIKNLKIFISKINDVVFFLILIVCLICSVFRCSPVSSKAKMLVRHCVSLLFWRLVFNIAGNSWRYSKGGDFLKKNSAGLGDPAQRGAGSGDPAKRGKILLK